MESVKDQALTAIKARRDLSPPLISVYNLLKIDKVETWAGLCCDRIADANLIDMEDVQIDFINMPGLCLTANGIMMCRDILEAYIGKDTLRDAFKWMCSKESINANINIAAQVLRDMSNSRLTELYREAESLQLPECVSARELIQEEMRQRLPFMALVRKVRKEYRLLPVRRILLRTKSNQ
ncbi:hypothetical protein [Lacrimispora indolis]|uniref:hypothetical protein n=1 Tax=Lacrimispora indolis TaxID=69825 RepID=UPI00045EC160|nr:hypothetical protein [Lacrimispora indolis]